MVSKMTTLTEFDLQSPKTVFAGSFKEVLEGTEFQLVKNGFLHEKECKHPVYTYHPYTMEIGASKKPCNRKRPCNTETLNLVHWLLRLHLDTLNEGLVNRNLYSEAPLWVKNIFDDFFSHHTNFEKSKYIEQISHYTDDMGVLNYLSDQASINPKDKIFRVFIDICKNVLYDIDTCLSIKDHDLKKTQHFYYFKYFSDFIVIYRTEDVNSIKYKIIEKIMEDASFETDTEILDGIREVMSDRYINDYLYINNRL